MSNVSYTPDKIDEMFHGYMSMHEDLINRMRSLIVPRSPVDPGAFVDEFLSVGQSPLTFTVQGDRTFLIDYIMYAYTPLAAATLSIGQTGGTIRTIPIPATSTNVPNSIPVAMLLKPGDVLTLTCAGATALFLEIMGRVLSGTDWSAV